MAEPEPAPGNDPLRPPEPADPPGGATVPIRTSPPAARTETFLPPGGGGRPGGAGEAAPGGTAASPAGVPERFGRYRVLGEVGRGGVGIVYRVRDAEVGRDLALKVLAPGEAGEAMAFQRFIEEAQVGGQLQHPGIVPVHELGLLPGEVPFFTMDYVEGETLAAILRGRRRPADDRPRLLGIFEALCQTLAYAHARGVIHRDLKPSNVMVGRLGEVLESLTPVERSVIRGRYGIGGDRLTLTDLARKLHFSREWVRQIEKRAMQKLRLPSRRGRLEGLD